MPESQIDFDTVRDIGLSLPEVEESTVYGSRALKLRGKLLTCIPINKSAEADSLAVSLDFDKRSVLLAAAPQTYYITDHYRPHPIVLVRLSSIEFDELRNLLKMAWQYVNLTAKGRALIRSRRRPSRR